ncbi:MAG: MbnP family protein [Bacteroidia bacterium]
MPTRSKITNFFAFVALVAISITIISCQPDDKPEPKYGKLIIKVANQVNGVDAVLNEMKYANKAANDYGITRIQYYLSNFQLSSTDCEDFIPENDYHLISLFQDPNIGDPSNDFIYQKDTFELKIPAGCYDELTFGMGVDPERNKEGPYDGDLDFSWNMNWSWSGDYIFFKNEGYYKSTTGDTNNFIFHIGDNSFYQTVNFAFDKTLDIAENETVTITLIADLNEFFANPNTIDLNKRSTTMSPGTLADSIRTNYFNMFSIEMP